MAMGKEEAAPECGPSRPVLTPVQDSHAGVGCGIKETAWQ